ncbi:MAG TPA: hypothetical protein VHT53_00785, partial [Candidatus Elarobacter sp.]|nr:hypothetical protein [Candidatus Elarobacter sp.]
LQRLDARWRKTPPVRVDWYKPPPRNTLPLLRYAVNPGKTLILKVVVLRAEADAPEAISVALFDIDGEFMFDTSFRGASKVNKVLAWLRDLFADKTVVDVAENDGQWAGSRYGPKGAPPLPGFENFAPAYSRSWLGKHDSP